MEYVAINTGMSLPIQDDFPFQPWFKHCQWLDPTSWKLKKKKECKTGKHINYLITSLGPNSTLAYNKGYHLPWLTNCSYSIPKKCSILSLLIYKFYMWNYSGMPTVFPWNANMSEELWQFEAAKIILDKKWSYLCISTPLQSSCRSDRWWWGILPGGHIHYHTPVWGWIPQEIHSAELRHLSK